MLCFVDKEDKGGGLGYREKKVFFPSTSPQFCPCSWASFIFREEKDQRHIIFYDTILPFI